MGSTITTTDTASLREAETKLDNIISQSAELRAKYEELKVYHARALAAEKEIAELRTRITGLEKVKTTYHLENQRLQTLVDQATACIPTVQGLVDKIDGAYTLPVPPPPTSIVPPQFEPAKSRRPPPPPPIASASDSETDSDELEPHCMNSSFLL